ncbi:MAG: glycosyl hydrolase 115 family protein [Opitutaceae bacterium]|nr:glycosyl hydrolase 115 family protein [Opitutaceae bacterium]
MIYRLIILIVVGVLLPKPVRAAAADPFPLVAGGHAATLVTSPADHQVVALAAADLATDIARVTGIRPATNATPFPAGGPLVLIGTLGRHPLIDGLVATGALAIGDLSGAWESFLITTIAHPYPGVSSALVIVGSDRRGTAYGIYELAQQIGVSPWHWWADVTPNRKTELLIPDGTHRFGPPSVKYRGIFLNDEDWGLQPWAAQNFEPGNGGIGPKTYAKVFELLLRLKANTLWPAMHACTSPFNADSRNARLADDYAIVMGSSHAEPLLRNNVREWTAPHDTYNYVTNRDGVLAYWAERVRTNGRYENLYTIGMRGIHDSAIQGTTTDAQRIKVLEQVFADQQALLGARPPSVAIIRPPEGIRSPPDSQPTATLPPQIFCAYKEVLDLYHQGLRVPDDVTIVWPDDNFGYIRSFAAPTERTRPGGFGVYYHISYLGRPLAYLWLNTTPPALIWSEMKKSYAHGADRVWIVNVGDLKTAEIGTEFFLRLAWDINAWGPDAQPAFLQQWAEREFGADHAPAVAGMLDRFYQLNFRRRPEHLQWWLPKEEPRASDLTSAEVDARLHAFATLRAHADRLAATLSSAQRDAFTQLVAYPIHGSALANVRYFSGEQGDFDSARAADADLRELTRQYNEELAGGKWRGFMHLEPADDDWKSMRIAPWEPRSFPAQSLPVPINPAHHWDAADFSRKIDKPGAAWTVIPGLGRSARAVTILPFDASSFDNPRNAPQLNYDFQLTESGACLLRLEFLPTHPLAPGRGLRLAIAVDEAPLQEVVVNVPDGSPDWARGVLDNRLIATVTLPVLPAGSHCLKVFMVDAGVVLDSLSLVPPGSAGGPPAP